MTNRSTSRSMGKAIVLAWLMALALTVAPAAAGAGTPPDTLLWDIAAGPQYVDPVMGTAAQANVMVVQNVYERLVWYDRASTQPIPWLATGWEVKDGGKRYVFKLRKGIKFHDGTEFDAKAVKFSFDRAVLIDDPTGIGSFFPTGTAAPGILKGAWEFSKAFGAGKDYSQAAVDRYMAAGGVRAIDASTVEFNLAQPYGAFITDLATFMGSIVSPSYALANWTKPTDPAKGFIPGVTAGQRDEWMLYHAAGTGPYRLESFDKATANVVLKANPAYWGGPAGNIKPKLQTVIVRATLDQATRLLNLKAGAVDIADIATAGIFDVIDKKKWLGEGKIEPIIPGVSVPGQFPWLTIYFAKMNLKIKNPDGTPAPFQPFQDVRVRKAFASVLDTADIRKNVFNGFAEPTTWGLTPAQFGYDPNVKAAYSFNLEQARKLLLDAGKDLGFGPDKPKEMVVIYNASAPWQGYIATQVAANISSLNVGLKLDVKPLSFTEYVNSWRSQLTGFSIHSTFSLTADPNSWLSAFGTAAGFWARTNSYDNHKADDLYTKQFQALDPKRRAQLIAELMQTVNDDVIWVWIGAATAYGQPTFNPNVLRSSVKGFYYNPTYQGFYFPALWKE
ncbi:MAG TPA: ABC transporter substrate-binding protein [Candidatus Methylomirabilis sp.]|nr:ABC transporter substrate-binding protein [Candidatus Methylomirabilis sp.]